MASRITVADLDEVLSDLVNWETFGIQLRGIEPSDIEQLKASNSLNKKIDLYTLWLRQCVNPDPSWEDVVKALKITKENRLAKKIEDEKIKGKKTADTGYSDYCSKDTDSVVVDGYQQQPELASIDKEPSPSLKQPELNTDSRQPMGLRTGTGRHVFEAPITGHNGTSKTHFYLPPQNSPIQDHQNTATYEFSAMTKEIDSIKVKKALYRAASDHHLEASQHHIQAYKCISKIETMTSAENTELQSRLQNKELEVRKKDDQILRMQFAEEKILQDYKKIKKENSELQELNYKIQDQNYELQQQVRKLQEQLRRERSKISSCASLDSLDIN